MRLCVGNLKVSHYTSSAAGLTELGAVCWEPPGLMGECMVATWGLIGVCSTKLGVYVSPTDHMRPVGPSLAHLGTVCWQPTGLIVLGLHVGKRQVLGLFDRAWGSINVGNQQAF